MSDEVYGELFALGQCMPGPTSTQVSFAIGVIKKGVPGDFALLAVLVAVTSGVGRTRQSWTAWQRWWHHRRKRCIRVLLRWPPCHTSCLL